MAFSRVKGSSPDGGACRGLPLRMNEKTPHFNFGQNWEQFSEACIGPEKLRAAEASIRELLGRDRLDGLRFLDVGCGSGLFAIAARGCGAAAVTGVDVNPQCIEVSRANAARLFPENQESTSASASASAPVFMQGSALDEAFMQSLGTFDCVYAWGSLHHTGDMWQAIRNTAQCVQKPDGLFVLAIYNRHWSCGGWTVIKRLYNRSPAWFRRVMAVTLGAVMYIAKLLVTRRNPLAKERGMNFWYDVIDWLGGYPYEYASAEEFTAGMQELGFHLLHMQKPAVPTGCNEFVFTSRAPLETAPAEGPTP